MEKTSYKNHQKYKHIINNKNFIYNTLLNLRRIYKSGKRNKQYISKKTIKNILFNKYFNKFINNEKRKSDNFYKNTLKSLCIFIKNFIKIYREIIYKLILKSSIYKILLIIFSMNQVANADIINNNTQSYFFTKEQSEAILENLKKPKDNKKEYKKKKKLIKKEYKLSGILWSEENEKWTVWINGNAYTKIGQYNDFSIDEVTKSSVTITTSDCKTIHLSVKCDTVSSKDVKK